VLDAEADAPLSRFREAPGLGCSGSAQFSARGFAQLLERIPADRLYVADLRQESHCFADGAALSWYAAMNWGCAGLDAAECAHLHFHCRGGKGRTAVFMALFDMLRNARRDSFDAVIERQAALGAYDLRRLPEEGNPKFPFAKERWSFLSRFHAGLA